MTANLDLIKHTAAVHINSVLTLKQRKIANVLLYNAYSEILEDKVHAIKLSKILEVLGWANNSEINNDIKVDLKQLNVFQLEWNILGKDRKNVWGATTLLADIKVENGYAYYTFSKSLREMLYNPNIYAKLDLIIQKKLKNKHGLVLWEYFTEILCSSKTNEIITGYIKLDDIRKLLGILDNKSYNAYPIFRAQALLPALKEINDKSDIIVTLIPKKEGRKVAYLSFNVQRKSPIIIEKENAITVNDNNFKDELRDNKWLEDYCSKLKFSVGNIKKDIDVFDAQRVKKAMQITIDAVNNDIKIKSLKGYYAKALKENWDPNISSIELKQTTDIQEFSEEMESILSTEIGLALELKKKLLEKYGNIQFKSWFKDLKVEELNNNTINIKAANEFKAERVATDYKEIIVEILTKLAPTVQKVEILHI